MTSMQPAGRGPRCSREIAFRSEVSLAEVSELGASQLMFAVAGDDRKIRKVSTQLRKQYVPSRLRVRRATPQARAPRR